MNIEKRYELIERNTQEILEPDLLREILQKKDKPVVYLGTSVTGKPHIGYFMWVNKMIDFLDAGFHVKILLADLHGALDNTPWDLLEKRYQYYEIVIKGLFKTLGYERDIEFVKGSSFQLTKEYIYDVYRFSTIASVHDALKATSEIVKQSENPKVSGLIYAIMQALDEVYLNADVQLGGNDQRKVFVFAHEYLPKLGYDARVHILLPLIPSFSQAGKMSSSDKSSKIDLIDDEKTVIEKMKKAYCPEGIVENNGVIIFLKYVIFEIKRRRKEKFIIERPEKWGGTLEYDNYESFEKDFIEKKVHPFDVKLALAKEINKLIAPIREDVVKHEKLIREAYPNE
ncbi:MAG: tyrosine--tRNA ligase [Candidatus Woesearchaeota archaeon]